MMDTAVEETVTREFQSEHWLEAETDDFTEPAVGEISYRTRR